MLCSGRIGNILRIFLSSLGVLLQFKQQLEYPSACNAHTSDIENIPPSIQCWYRSPAVSKALRSVQRIRRQRISCPKPRFPFRSDNVRSITPDERRDGNEWFRTSRSSWSLSPYQLQITIKRP